MLPLVLQEFHTVCFEDSHFPSAPLRSVLSTLIRLPVQLWIFFFYLLFKPMESPYVAQLLLGESIACPSEVTPLKNQQQNRTDSLSPKLSNDQMSPLLLIDTFVGYRTLGEFYFSSTFLESFFKDQSILILFFLSVFLGERY